MIDKEEFYNLLQSVGRDIRHNITCDKYQKIFENPINDCNCYEDSVLDKDVDRLNEILNSRKITKLSAMKLLITETIK